MAFEQVNTILVRYCSSGQPIDMGRLALRERKIFFEYFPTFLELGLELSPYKLPLNFK